MQGNGKELDSEVARKLAHCASRLQEQRTGHFPTSVSVALLDDTLVVTLHDALTYAEKDLAKSPVGAHSVQEYHRRLFANDNDEMRLEIKRLTGRDVREAGSEVEPATGTVGHAFTTGAMVQVFLLTPSGVPADMAIPAPNARIESTQNIGLHLFREPDS